MALKASASAPTSSLEVTGTESSRSPPATRRAASATRPTGRAIRPDSHNAASSAATSAAVEMRSVTRRT